MEKAVFKKDKNIIELALILLLFLVLLWALYKVIGPFFGVFTYATILGVSFAKSFDRLCRLFAGRKLPAAIVYVILLIGIMALPFLFFLNALGKYFHHAQELLTDIRLHGIPPLPDWIVSLPMVGENIQHSWSLMQQDPNASLHVYEHQIRAVLTKLAHEGAGLLGAGFEMILGIIISSVFLVNKEKILPVINKSIQHIVGYEDGPALLDASGKAVRGVAIGVMGTGLITAVLAWIAYTIAGIPFTTILAALIFLVTIIQVGAWIVWLPVAIWLGYTGHTGQAIFLVVFGVILMIIDTFLKPLLIAKSGKLPVLVLFVGVLGGLVAWGFTGMFKGAIVLSVAYTIFQSWISRHPFTDIGSEPHANHHKEHQHHSDTGPHEPLTKPSI